MREREGVGLRTEAADYGLAADLARRNEQFTKQSTEIQQAQETRQVTQAMSRVGSSTRHLLLADVVCGWIDTRVRLREVLDQQRTGCRIQRRIERGAADCGRVRGDSFLNGFTLANRNFF